MDAQWSVVNAQRSTAMQHVDDHGCITAQLSRQKSRDSMASNNHVMLTVTTRYKGRQVVRRSQCGAVGQVLLCDCSASLKAGDCGEVSGWVIHAAPLRHRVLRLLKSTFPARTLRRSEMCSDAALRSSDTHLNSFLARSACAFVVQQAPTHLSTSHFSSLVISKNTREHKYRGNRLTDKEHSSDRY